MRPLPECRALVLGGGAIGMLAALLLQNYGVRHVTVGETNALRREALAHATRAATYDPLGTSPADNSMDVVIDAVGAAATRTAALAAVKPGGVVVHVGLMDWASEIDMRKLTLAEITLIGTYTYSTADLRAAALALHERVRRSRLGRGAAARRRRGGVPRPARRPGRRGQDRTAPVMATPA